jgi:hypothetical protein
MKPLDLDMGLGWPEAEDVIVSFKVQPREALDPRELRAKITGSGRLIGQLAPKARPASFLACDCASATAETRYNALWAGHAVAVYAEFDGARHHDALVGHSTIPYGGLRYGSYLSAREFIPYSDVDVRSNLARVAHESTSTLEAHRELAAEGRRPEFTLIDGSIHTNLSSLEERLDYPEYSQARDSFKAVLGLGKAVGIVEDSHATDLARELGYDFTNMLLMDVALEPGEYVTDQRGGVSICYVRLPAKPMPHLPDGRTRPMTVRWEFDYGGYEDDLNLLSALWLAEDDHIHPQHYPLRIADHLTRKIKVAGILDEIRAKHGLEQKYRELRQG